MSSAEKKDSNELQSAPSESISSEIQKNLGSIKETFGDSRFLKGADIDKWRDSLSLLSDAELKKIAPDIAHIHNNLIADRNEKRQKYLTSLTPNENYFDIDSALKFEG